MHDRLRVALVGCGVMGTRHASVVAADPSCELAVAVDVVPERAAQLAARHGARACARVPREIDVVIVATPTSTHAGIALPLLARAQWCLVEKPLAHRADDARALSDARCAVGHVERFNPAVRSAGPMRPRVIEARRISPPTGRGTDVDVVLDLMIHDLDLVLGWAAPGAEVAWIDTAGVGVAGDGIDTASVRLRTTCGLTATLLASRVADTRQRTIRCFEPGRYTSLDLLAGIASRDGAPLPRLDALDGLTAQWAAFTGAVRGERPALATARDGARAVDLAERVRSALREAA